VTGRQKPVHALARTARIVLVILALLFTVMMWSGVSLNDLVKAMRITKAPQ
jgi:hypothetical protein